MRSCQHLRSLTDSPLTLHTALETHARQQGVHYRGLRPERWLKQRPRNEHRHLVAPSDVAGEGGQVVLELGQAFAWQKAGTDAARARAPIVGRACGRVAS